MEQGSLRQGPGACLVCPLGASSLDGALGGALAQAEASYWVCRREPPGRGPTTGRVQPELASRPEPPGMSQQAI